MNSNSSIYVTIFIIVLLGINTYLIYESKKTFECPDCNCPACPPLVVCDIPSNQSYVNYLRKTLIDPFLETKDISKFLNENVVFSEKNTLLAIDYEKINAALRGSIDNNRYKINENNLRYMYPKQGDETNFLNTYRLSEFPTPLLTFADTGLYFGYLSSAQSWKIFVDNQVLLKK
ncbi:hypothetical protein CPAV1605_395 [seawater metagenome]|uniref:Uncharacterized protein n=1 Tax=seawater metagenome TaxID=1561972 RepID=A0A5E8CM02_9ZZZZ